MNAVAVDPIHLLRRLEGAAGGRLPLTLGRGAGDADVHAVDDADPLSRWWLCPGAVVELSALPGAGALSAAFALAVRARARALAAGRSGWLCALDPSGTLSAPALQHLGVDLGELVVARPSEDRLLACATRACRAGGVAALVVDAGGMGDLGGLPVPLRRLTLAAEEQHVAVVLVTSSRARRALPLPCAARALVDVAVDGGVELRGVRHRHGLPPRVVVRPARSVIDELLHELRVDGVVDADDIGANDPIDDVVDDVVDVAGRAR